MTPGKTGKVLVVDDDEDVLLAARLCLKPHVAVVQTESNPESLPVLLRREAFDVVLLDMNFAKDVTSGQEGFEWLERMLSIDPSAIVIMMTAYADFGLAVRAIKEGATDFVEKPWKNEKLVATVSTALELGRSRREVSHLRTSRRRLSEDLDEPFSDIIGSSLAMENVFSVVERVAPTDANILITGENGTGKELMARVVHRRSQRAEEIFVKVDMGALSETLFESELFGHVKGAFTDAREDRAGRFEVASGGSLFLDEIANLPLDLQAKILTALQEREITRVGSNLTRHIDIRLICATNTSLPQLVEQGRFREDLYYRINTVEIHLPSLKDRREDIPLLVEHFVRKYSVKYRKEPMRIQSGALKKLKRYTWPGNVRELQHAVERAVIMAGSDVLQPEDFLVTSTERTDGEVVLDSLKLEDVEKVVIRKALAKHGGNVSRVARELGLSRTSLYRRMKLYGL
jgi:two-component system response regulator HydG